MSKSLVLVSVIALLLLAGSVSAKSVYYPGHGNGAGTFNTYTGATCTNQGASSPCARYDEGSLRIDMDLDTVKYQVQNSQGTWRYIQYDISNPTNLIPSPQSNPKSLVWNGMYANNTNLRYVMQSHGIKLDIWGKGVPPSNYFNFTYSLSAGVTYRMQGEEILFMDAVTGEPLWLVKYPSMKVNGTDVPLEFKRDGDKISIHAPDLFTNPDYNFSAGWELDPSTQSGSTIYISDRHNLTEVNADIANASALSNLGGGEWLLNANLINNNTANTFYLNSSDVIWLKINSTNTSGTPTYWYYLTNGKTEINNTKITSWNTTSNDVENTSSVLTWARSYVYASGSSSKMNISNSNLSYMGYNLANGFGVSYVTSSGNQITNSTFLYNSRGVQLSTTSNNNTIVSNTFTNNNVVGLGVSSGSSYNNLTSNTVSTSSYGIYLNGGANYNNVTLNNCTMTTGVGIHVEGSNYNKLTSNKGTSVSNYGIFIYSNSNNNILTNNTGTALGSGVGIYIYTSSNNNILTSNTGSSSTYIGILLQSVSGNTLISNTGTSNTNRGIGIQLSSNNNFTSNIFNTNSTTSTIADIWINGGSRNNTFTNTSFTKPRKILFYSNLTSEFNQSQDGGISFVNTNVSIASTTNRSIANWTQSNITFTETYTVATQANYSATGLLPNADYWIYNGTTVFDLTTDANGKLPDFMINFSTTARTVSILEISIPTIISWGNDYTLSNATSFSVARNTTVTFNATADQTLTGWNWTGASQINGSGLSYSYANQTFPDFGIYSVTVNGTNAYGSTQTVTWNITVRLTNLTLNGYVNNSLGAYLKDALVTFNGSHVLTDSVGYYNFSGISEEDYLVLVQAIGYRNSTETIYMASNITHNITMNERKAPVKAPGFELPLLFISLITIYLYTTRKRG